LSQANNNNEQQLTAKQKFAVLKDETIQALARLFVRLPASWGKFNLRIRRISVGNYSTVNLD